MAIERQTDQGRELRRIRQLHSHTLEQLAQKLGVSKSYLSKIENGQKPVSNNLLGKYAQVYGKDSARLSDLFFGGHKVLLNNSAEGAEKYMDKQANNTGSLPANVQQMQVSFNPETTPVLYTDGTVVNANDGGITFNFLQQFPQAGPTVQSMQQVVARLGMSHAQARALYNDLEKLLREYYKSKDMEF